MISFFVYKCIPKADGLYGHPLFLYIEPDFPPD